MLCALTFMVVSSTYSGRWYKDSLHSCCVLVNGGKYFIFIIFVFVYPQECYERTQI